MTGQPDEDEHKKTFTELSCPICMDCIWSDTVGVTDPCGHMFHQSCWNSWDSRTRGSKKTKCPMCQTEVKKLQNVFGTNVGGSCSNSTNAASCELDTSNLEKIEELEAAVEELREERCSLLEYLSLAQKEAEDSKSSEFQLKMEVLRCTRDLKEAHEKIEDLKQEAVRKETLVQQLRKKLELGHPEMIQITKKYSKAQSELQIAREENRTLRGQVEALENQRITSQSASVRLKNETTAPNSEMSRNANRDPLKKLSEKSCNFQNPCHSDNRISKNQPPKVPEFSYNSKSENTVLGGSLKVARAPASANSIISTKIHAVRKTSTALDALSFKNINNKKDSIPKFFSMNLGQKPTTNSWPGKENSNDDNAVVSKSFIHVASEHVRLTKRRK